MLESIESVTKRCAGSAAEPRGLFLPIQDKDELVPFPRRAGLENIQQSALYGIRAPQLS